MVYKVQDGVLHRGWGSDPVATARGILGSTFGENEFSREQAEKVLQENGFKTEGKTSTHWLFAELIARSAVVVSGAEAIGIP